MPSDIRIISQYHTLDEKVSPKYVNCAREIQTFRTREMYDCSFTIEGLEFDILQHFLFDYKGNLKEFWDYKAEGPLVYTMEALKKDLPLFKQVRADRKGYQLSEDGLLLVNLTDTLPIEKIFRKQQIILIQQFGELKKRDQRILFEYELLSKHLD
ncbi:hypothetical protein GCM10022393_05240 [Aquimarina addita]|uniref:IPExxxVDY family protein n=1 Tax=Aquimarina addita TaxID=870485 RepID=A0ABP7XAD5_9FLAO